MRKREEIAAYRDYIKYLIDKSKQDESDRGLSNVGAQAVVWGRSMLRDPEHAARLLRQLVAARKVKVAS